MPRKVAAFGLALLLLALLAAPAALAIPAAQASATVRISQVDTTAYPRVTLYVNVVDANGRTVEGLRGADFRVVEGGIQVPVKDFAGLAQQRPVDVVFVLDTTSSMQPSIEGIKETCVAFAETLAQRNRDYHLGLVTFGDQVRESHPFTDQVSQFRAWVAAQQADGGGSQQEDSLGALQHAATFPFRPGAQHLVVLVTDAPAHLFGDSPDEEATFNDRALTVEATRARLAAGSISVYAVAPDLPEFRDLAETTGGELYTNSTDLAGILNRLGTALASQYRFAYESPRPAFDGSRREVQVTVQGVAGRSFYLTPQGTFYNSLRTPLQISTDPAVVGTNAGLAILLALLFGLTSTLFNDTLKANREAFDHSLLGRVLAALKAFGQALIRPFGNLGLQGRKVRAYIEIALFLALTGLIGCFLDPSFRPFSWAGVGLFFSMLCSVGLVNLVYEGAQVLASRRFHLDAAIKLNPAGILMAVGCVLFSRLVGFLPGYLYGIAGGYALGSAVELSRRREAAISGAGLGAAAILALLAWGLTVPFALLQGAGPVAGVAAVLQSFLLTIFFVGLEVVFLELFPLGPTEGAAVFHWNKVVWGLAFGVAAFIAAHTLLTPESAYLDTVRNHSLQLLLGLLALYSILAVALWFFFEARGSASRSPLCPACGHENDPGDRFCVQCGILLPASGPHLPSRQGLAMVIVLGLLWLAIGVAVLLAALGVA